MEVLLFHLFQHIMSCHIFGRSRAYLAEIFNFFDTVYLYVVKKGAPVQNILFQRWGRTEYFSLEGFGFRLFYHHIDDDIVKYTLTYGEFCTHLSVYRIDSVDPSGPESNMGFVHFVWNNIEQHCFVRHSVTLPILPLSSPVPRRSTSTITGLKAMGEAFVA